MRLPRVAILDDYQGLAMTLTDWSSLSSRAEVVVFRENLGTIEAAARALADYDVLCLMRERQPLTAELIARLPQLKFVVSTGTWNASIDLEAASANGVLICGTPNGRGQRATAELTWGLILALSRNICSQDAMMRSGGWAGQPGKLLEGKVLGLIGFGGVAAMVADYAQVFGMKVLTASRSKSSADLPAYVELTSLEYLLANADVVSLHNRLTQKTRGMITYRELESMKSSAFLINTARGLLVDENALISALQAEQIAGAALDVWAEEPLPSGHPFREFGPRLILSPHMGYVTQETMIDFYNQTRDAVLAWLDGRPIGLLFTPV